MNMKRWTSALAVSLLTATLGAQTVFAQSASSAPINPSLNLKLPPSDLSAPSVPAASASSAQPVASSSAPGKYYGDTSGRMGRTDVAEAPACDDSTYDKAQVHGSVSTGVVSASHMGTGFWNAGNVNITKRLGSCDDPSGSIGVSISVSKSQFNDHRRGSGYGY